MYIALQPAQSNWYTTLDLYFLGMGSLGEKYCPILQGKKATFAFALLQKELEILSSLPRNFIEFDCAGCNAMYIGETTVHFSTRIHQHFFKGTGPSAVYKHLGKHRGRPNKCRKACNESSFKIIDGANTKYALRLKEGMHIRWNNEPVLNKQVKFEKIQLSV